MTPCPGCSRHVRDGELACPFCGGALAVPRPRAQVIGRVTRAAVFSAALVACGGKKDEAKPVPQGSAEHLDQDFNQLLGSAEAHPAASDAGVAQVAIDAATVDAGLSDEERTRQLQRAQEEQQQQRRRQQQQHEIDEQIKQQQIQRQDWHNVAKPYGAPPARRRVV